MRESLTSPNDRLRTVAYSFFEHNPDRALVPQLLAAWTRNRGVRPSAARPRARGARRDDPRVRQALLREAGRGEDFFRSAVIEALGDFKATYAFDALTGDRQARWSAAGRCRRWRWERSGTNGR